MLPIALTLLTLVPVASAGERKDPLPPAAAPSAALQVPAPAQEPTQAPGAQRPTPAPKPVPEAEPEPAIKRTPPQPVNVKIDVTITDERASRPPLTKTLSLTLADRERGSVRSSSEFPMGDAQGDKIGLRPVELNLDARPSIYAGKVMVELTLMYNFLDAAAGGRYPSVGVQDRMSVLLDNGKPLVIAQSADPVTDRKVTLEVKATVLK